MYYTIKNRTPGSGRGHYGKSNQLNNLTSPFILIEGIISAADLVAAGFRTFAYIGQKQIDATHAVYSNRETVYNQVKKDFNNTALYTMTSNLIKHTVRGSKDEHQIPHGLTFYMDGKEVTLRNIKEQCCDKCDQRVKCLYSPDTISNYYCSPKSITSFNETNSNTKQRTREMIKAMGMETFKAGDNLLDREYVSLTVLTDTVGFFVNEVSADEIDFSQYTPEAADSEVVTKRFKIGAHAALTRKLQKEKCPSCLYLGDTNSKHERCGLGWQQCWKNGWKADYHDEAIFYKDYQYLTDLTKAAVKKLGGYPKIKHWMSVCNEIVIMDRKQYVVAVPLIDYTLTWKGIYLLNKKRVNMCDVNESCILQKTEAEIKQLKTKSMIYGRDINPTDEQADTYVQLLLLLMNSYNRNGDKSGYRQGTNYGDTRDILLSGANIDRTWSYITGIAFNTIIYRYKGYYSTYKMKNWEDIVNTLRPLQSHFISADSLTGIFFNNE